MNRKTIIHLIRSHATAVGAPARGLAKMSDKRLRRLLDEVENHAQFGDADAVLELLS